MTRVNPDNHPTPQLLPAPTDAKSRGASGLSREALARHGGMLTSTGQARPATTDFSRMPSRTAQKAAAFRPRSLRAAAVPKPPHQVGQAGARGVEAAPQSLVQARAAWLEVARTMPTATGVLRPQAAQGSLEAGEANVVRDNLRLLSLPEAGERWLVTEYDPRAESQAKRRRWAISDAGTFACCLEFLPFHERGLDERALHVERTRKLGPQEAQSRAAEVREHEAEVIQEVQTAALLNRDLEVHAFFRTEDGRLVAIMTDFPEEVSYLSRKLTGAQREAMAYRLFGEVALRLHQDLHRKGLVHGDIKPANIMMTAAGTYTLIDFEHTRPVAADGLVAAEGCLQATFAPPEYHATERMGKAGDMWALGVSFAHMFFFANVEEVLSKVENNPRMHRRLSQAYERVWPQFAQALEQGAFEPHRQALAQAADPAAAVAALAALTRSVPYLAALQPLATATPEIFHFAIGSLLARDPELRKDARAARELGQSLLAQHQARIEANRSAEQQVLQTSASLEMVAPVLRTIADEEAFHRA